ncbi:MAG: hypothetical protein ACP5QW_01210 [bacterium]
MSNLYCSVCGRSVNPTVHLKDHYIVDYYVEVTGDTERVSIAIEEQDKIINKTYLKLITRKEIIRCIDCIKKR